MQFRKVKLPDKRRKPSCKIKGMRRQPINYKRAIDRDTSTKLGYKIYTKATAFINLSGDIRRCPLSKISLYLLCDPSIHSMNR
jgi:hypothetical protein